MEIFYLIGIFLVLGFAVVKITKIFPDMPGFIKILIEVGFVLAAAVCFLKISHVI